MREQEDISSCYFTISCSHSTVNLLWQNCGRTLWQTPSRNYGLQSPSNPQSEWSKQNFNFTNISRFWQKGVLFSPWCTAFQPISDRCLNYFYGDHPRRPRGSQSGRDKSCDESFQAWVEEPLGTDSQRTISKRSSECWLLIGHKKCFVLFCPIGEQFLLSSFREFVHDGYCLDHGLSGSCTKEMHAVRKLSVWYKLSSSKYCLPEN